MTNIDIASAGQSLPAKDPVEGSRETVEKELKQSQQDGPQGRHSRAAETARQERAQGAQPNLSESGDPTLQSGDETRSLEPGARGKKAKLTPQPSAPSGLE